VSEPGNRCHLLKGFRLVIDKTKDGLRREWATAGTHVAVAAAALLALLSLFHRVPVWVACLRGLGAFLAATLVVRGFGWLLSVTRQVRVKSAGHAAKATSTK